MFVDYFIAASIAIIAVVDVVLFVRPPHGDTISERLRAWSRHTPFIPYAWGGLGGHFFAPPLSTHQPPGLLAAVLILLSLWLLVIGVFMRKKLSWWEIAGFFFFGLVAGGTLWNQG